MFDSIAFSSNDHRTPDRGETQVTVRGSQHTTPKETGGTSASIRVVRAGET